MSKRTSRVKSLILSLLCCVLLCACSARPRRVVVADDPEFSSTVFDAIDELEEVVGCRHWKTVVVGGKKRDWRGRFPPLGTVTIEHKPSRVPDGYLGNAVINPRGLARIYLMENPPHRVTVVHELLHTLWLDHDMEGEGLMEDFLTHDTIAEAWETTPLDTKAQILEQCLPEVT